MPAPGAYLTAIVTRRCIDHLRSARVRRKSHIGPWLPAPLVRPHEASPADEVGLADTLSMAFLIVLERLSPVERAAFLLHAVFGYAFDEIAPMVGKTAVNCRQIAHRARRRLREDRPRFDAAPEERARLAERFAHAVHEGDLDELLTLLARDAVLYSDGGGRVAAALRPLHTAAHVGRFLVGLSRKAPPGFHVEAVAVNGAPGFLVTRSGVPENVFALHVEGGRIRKVFVVRNPDKLRRVSVGGS